MASKLRYVSGVVQYLVLPTANDAAAAHAIEEGDLVYVTGGVAYPASHLADGGSAAVNRAAFAAAFCGVAVQKVGLQSGETSFKLTTDPGYILVAVTGCWRFVSAATSWAPGDMVGVYNDATDNSDQQVAKVTAYNEAIGVAVVPYAALGSSQTEIVVMLRSPFIYDAVQSGN
jgi:hypothetical protein